jgi:serine/threonine protein phosphatase PrpC/DNA-binding transcriptional MerR regulator
MELLSIGAFARASRLSPKALRLYDDLGLLPPARVDSVTAYRFYAPQQLERARLVAWLRRIGLPLARIQQICELEPVAAAQAVAAFWAEVESDVAARRDLASFLIDHLSGKDSAMPVTSEPLAIRYAARSDTGLVRPSNQDAVHAGARLLAVADGFGTGGGPAGAAAIDALRGVDVGGVAPGELLNLLGDAVGQVVQAVRDVAERHRGREQNVGTTLTAMLWTGSQLALVHIGDSRAYLLRAGELFQITHDDTVVQAMVDEGRLGPEEALTHPDRAMLLRALGVAGVRPELKLRDVRAGDRYLLCSDGLSAVVAPDAVHDVLAGGGDPEATVAELVLLARRAGGPDNVSCVVADLLEAA